MFAKKSADISADISVDASADALGRLILYRYMTIRLYQPTYLELELGLRSAIMSNHYCKHSAQIRDFEVLGKINLYKFDFCVILGKLR